MYRKIRDLDVAALFTKIERATDARTRKACVSTIQADLSFVKSIADAVETLRNHVVLAALDHAKRIDEISFSDPLIQAFVRCQNHPAARPLPPIRVEGGLAGPDATPTLASIAAAHPELEWNAAAVQDLLITAIKTAGDVEVDDAYAPWLISWEPVGAAAYALFTLVTLRTSVTSSNVQVTAVVPAWNPHGEVATERSPRDRKSPMPVSP